MIKDKPAGSVEPLPPSDSSDPSHVEPDRDLTAAKPLPPSFSDSLPTDKESRKEGEVAPLQEEDQELKKEDAPMPSPEEQEKDSKDGEVTFESLPDKPSELVEPDFSPDHDEDMSPGSVEPLQELQDSSVCKDTSLGAKPKSAPTS